MSIKYNAEYHDDWAWSLAIRGATDQDIAEAFGVSRRTVIRWRQEHKSFEESIMRGKQGADARVEKALFNRAIGYDVEDRETVVDTDKNGNVKPVRVRTTTRHIAGDVAAMCFWLKNRNADEWSDRKQGTVEVEDIDAIKEAIFGDE